MVAATEPDVRSDDIVGATLRVSKAWRYLSVATAILGSQSRRRGLGLSVGVAVAGAVVDDLSRFITIEGAIIAVALVAYIPALLMSFGDVLAARSPASLRIPSTAGVTIVIAARNEEAASRDDPPCRAHRLRRRPVKFMLATTARLARRRPRRPTHCSRRRRQASSCTNRRRGRRTLEPRAEHWDRRMSSPSTPTPCCTAGLAATRLTPESAPRDTVAVAGAVMIRNSRRNLLTRMQEWDYFLGIAAVKRMQGMYQSTLVAQGAFSLYRTDELRRIGGWPDAIGEDIVVTWRLMEAGDRVLTEPTAIAFTDAPTRLTHFMRQRARWARGMVEALRSVPPWHQRRLLARVVAGIDLLIPLLDIGYALIWLPGLLLAAFGFRVVDVDALGSAHHCLAADCAAAPGLRPAATRSGEPPRLSRVHPGLPAVVDRSVTGYVQSAGTHPRRK